MHAVDTNVIIRYLTRDDPEQSTRAKAVVDAGDILVSTTVLLETEWVLRSIYRFRPQRIVKALRLFAGLRGIMLEEPGLAAQALDWFERGLDFADALHLAKALGCEGFLTFDRALVRTANRLGNSTVHAL